ncbi:hypothetical protein AQB9606_00290 [Aquabacterium sp. CECT 9606]|nr:hypothetical protein AQB9606_00290 [Aquabacterium sp. CECT 9606]
MDKEMVQFCLNWVSTNAHALVQLLSALAPVVALAVVGYALHVTDKNRGSK